MYAGRIVEYADKDTIFAAPEHPYTWGLLQVDPAPGLAARRGARPDPGPPAVADQHAAAAARSTRAARTCARRTSASTRSSSRPPTASTAAAQVACLLAAADAPRSSGPTLRAGATPDEAPRSASTCPRRPSTTRRSARSDGRRHRGEAPRPRPSDGRAAHERRTLIEVRDLVKHFPLTPGHPASSSRSAPCAPSTASRFDVMRGRDARPRRRVGLRQVDDRAPAHAPARADRAARSVYEGQRHRALVARASSSRCGATCR